MKQSKKIISILLTTCFLFVQTTQYVFASPSAPSAPSAPTIPNTSTTTVNVPTVVVTAPSAPSAPTYAAPTPTPTPESGATSVTTETTGSFVDDGNSGDTAVNTGDITTSATLVTAVNTNLASSGSVASASGTQDETGISIGGNGTHSENTGATTIEHTNTTTQTNSASVTSNVTQGAVTGDNSASSNVGSSSITTGDANVSGTIITAVNTNVAGVTVAEFNVADDHLGDIVLDFGSTGTSACITGCGMGDSAGIDITGNGNNATNSGTIDITNNNVTFQSNDATIGSNLVLTADSGSNTASRNTNGDASITTGDANIAANVLTFANNNIVGNVLYGVVNIFGNLIGDILLPDTQVQSPVSSDTGLAIGTIGNGADTSNTATITQETNNALFQSNDVNITNSLTFDATTGENTTNANTSGNNRIATGDGSVIANVLNIANTNLAGGTMWLVIVNEAGNWVGKIFGAPEGSHYAGSSGTQFAVDSNGFITASNNANGDGSTNTTAIASQTNNTTTQINRATIDNNLDLTANTGRNDASSNTGGDSSITTGDATIVANLVNFVNNNIAGGGKLVVTVVNVFGSWSGDFITPGHTQESTNQPTDTAIAENISSDNRGGTNDTQPTPTPQQDNQSTTPSQTTDTQQNITTDSPTTQQTQSPTVLATTQTTSPTNGNGTTFIYTTTGASPTPVLLADRRGAMVAGVHTQTANDVVSVVNSTPARSITINLAWFATLLPLLFIMLLVRKVALRFVTRKRLYY